MMTVKTERVEARFLPEIKQLAERAALASGITLTDYLARLVVEDAPKTLESHTQIKLTNEQFDRFIAICESEQQPSQKLIDIAKRLDTEGF